MTFSNDFLHLTWMNIDDDDYNDDYDDYDDDGFDDDYDDDW